MYATQYDKVVQTVAEEFRISADKGFLRDDVDYVAVVRRYIAMSDGLQLRWVLSGGSLDLVGPMREYLEQLAAALRAAPAAAGAGGGAAHARRVRRRYGRPPGCGRRASLSAAVQGSPAPPRARSG
ncbi:TetR family transcriptional regulator C-terminal domain-containing protein [Streptomyces sp. NPDC001833]|uniref:TetR family transcriptional regulator C-terminal domain-containing protein n=1 Tax=Streptomyces sp. NPDC001833 TaxID=3154658 RepID=UPI003327C22E